MTKRNIHHYNKGKHSAIWRENLNAIIFGVETRTGKLFDILLIISIAISVLLVMLSSVQEIHIKYERLFHYLEWFFTGLFSLEYIARLIAVRKPLLYAFSFFGLIDLLSILPTYLALFIAGSEYFLIIRILRLLRIFRIFKLVKYIDEAEFLISALKNSYQKILVFLYAVLTIAIVCGSLLYVIEGSAAGFTSIPESTYWAIVTLTTVGYGNISPQTPLGQFIAACIMIIGYGIIAVPTGIYSAELIKMHRTKPMTNHACPSCGKIGHDHDADYCKYCGETIEAA
jgi:voltage-gated potassium channel